MRTTPGDDTAAHTPNVPLWFRASVRKMSTSWSRLGWGLVTIVQRMHAPTGTIVAAHSHFAPDPRILYPPFAVGVDDDVGPESSRRPRSLGIQTSRMSKARGGDDQ